MENHLFYYFGDDEAYFKTLQGEFKKHTKLSCKFKRFFEIDESKIQSLFLNVYRDKPTCVFIDFSKQTPDYLHLARLIGRTPLEHKLVSIGLVDYLSPPDVIQESMTTGMNVTHVKSAEVFDVVFDVMKLVSPGDTPEHGFATAALKESWDAGLLCKIGYIHEDYLHFETDYKFSKGDRIKFTHHWAEKKIVPSMEMFVKEVNTNNMFYHYKYAVDASFVFIDEFLPPEGMEEERVKEKIKERNELILHHQKMLTKWIEDNQSRSQEKKSKLLVIDKDFHFYQDQIRTDKHPYTVRCHPCFENIGEELAKFHPQVIAIAMEKVGAPNIKNTLALAEDLIQIIKTDYSELHPYLILFNLEADSKELQQRLNYPYIITSKDELSVAILLRMEEILEKKMKEHKSKATLEDVVFIKKNNPASIGEVIIPLKIVKLSETDMIFQTESPLSPGTNLHLLKPVDMYINVQPAKNSQSKIPEFHGLIHAIGELQKKELRRYVNSVFFRDHDAQLASETSEFKKLNETKLQEKTELEAAKAKDVEDKKEPA